MSCEHVQYFHQREDRCCVKFFQSLLQNGLAGIFLNGVIKLNRKLINTGVTVVTTINDILIKTLCNLSAKIRIRTKRVILEEC